MVAHFLRGFSYSIPIGGGLSFFRVSEKERKGAKNQKTHQEGHEFSVCFIFYVYLHAVCLLLESPFLIKMQSFAPGVPARVRAIGDCARPRPLLLL